MKLRDFSKVSALYSRRSELLAQLSSIGQTGLGVTIDGRYQDDAMKDVVRPYVARVINSRIEAVDEALRELGVQAP